MEYFELFSILVGVASYFVLREVLKKHMNLTPEQESAGFFAWSNERKGAPLLVMIVILVIVLVLCLIGSR
ncbi:MAG: hypothetical protein OS112_06925 [Methanoregula sp.]|nr:MAG: hypothetical protein OS112_06925 [Methanoregula sp.]